MERIVMNHLLKLIFAAVLAVGAGQSATAAVVDATPSTLAAQLNAATPGDTLRLAAGRYAGLTLRGANVSIDASAATLERITVRDTEGLRLVGGAWGTGCAPEADCSATALTILDSRRIVVEGGAFQGPAGVADGAGILARRSFDVTLADLSFKRLAKGARFLQVDGFSARRIDCAGQRIDCVTLAGSSNGLVEDVVCRDTKITANEHPDCVQAWILPGEPPPTNLTVRRMLAVGDTQGVGFFDGPFGRVVVEDTEVYTTRANGITVNGAAELVLRNNRLRTLPGARLITTIRTRDSLVVERCGNSVAAGAGKRGATEGACLK